MDINPTRAVFGCICLFSLVAANKPITNTSTKLNYSPYELMIWEIKANEGFMPHWYKDGFVYNRKLKKSVQSYSIGFGWNDQGCRRKEAKPFLNSSGKITFESATKLTLYEIGKYGKLHNDPLKNLALRLYSYSRGLTRDGSKLGGCCGYNRGCGHKNKDVRKSHARRRKFEVACWNHDYATINAMTEVNRQKISMMK